MTDQPALGIAGEVGPEREVLGELEALETIDDDARSAYICLERPRTQVLGVELRMVSPCEYIRTGGKAWVVVIDMKEVPPMLADRAQLRCHPTAFIPFPAVVLACMLVVSATATGASADDVGNHLYDRFQFGVAGSLLLFGGNVRIDAEDGSVGTDVNIVDELGFTTTTFQPRLGLRWRPGHRHELEVGYQFARRSAENTLERTISVGDTSFAAGSQINSVFNTDNAVLTYRYAIMAHERTQLGAALGLGAFFFKVDVDDVLSRSSNEPRTSADHGVTESFVGPTLSLGLYGRFRIGDRWYVAPDVRYLQFTIERFTPRILEGGLIGQYYISRKVGLEAGYGLRGVELDVGPSPEGSVIDLGFLGSVKYSESQFRLGVVLPF